MNDREILGQINQLVDEEHELMNKNGLSQAERARLDAVQVALDRCWDLLRQRRARREFGGNPDKAHVRPAEVVEKYEQ
jgi:hypothetical protein